jgi:hypothetical protein
MIPVAGLILQSVFLAPSDVWVHYMFQYLVHLGTLIYIAHLLRPQAFNITGSRDEIFEKE